VPTPSSRRPSVDTRLPSLLCILLALAIAGFAEPALGQTGRQVTFTDLMQVRQTASPTLSLDGAWLAFTAEPDRGDPEVVVHGIDAGVRFAVPLADRPVISEDGRWVGARTVASLESREREGRDAPRSGMALVSLPGGAVERVEDVASFGFAPGGGWLAYHLRTPRDEDQGGDEADRATLGAEGEGTETEGREVGEPGSTLVIRHLGTGAETRVDHVRDYAFHPDGRAIAYSVAGDGPDADALHVVKLGDAAGPAVEVHTGSLMRYAGMAWQEDGDDLAFFAGSDGDGVVPGAIYLWDGDELSEVATADDAPDGWIVPSNANPAWSEDGERLFFGWRPLRADEFATVGALGTTGVGAETPNSGEGGGAQPEPEPFDPYDVDAILADRGVDVWHVDDPLINPQQKVLWDRMKDRTFLAVWHDDGDRVVSLGGPDLPDVDRPENGDRALASSDVPYRKAYTWAGGQQDLYLVELESGARTMLAEQIRNGGELSPEGRYAVWWHDGNYHLHDARTGETRNLTAGVDVPWADEDHDYPEPAPGYGIAGWSADDRTVLIYDKYDIWAFPLGGGEAMNLTQGLGRAESRIFRIIETGDEDGVFARGQELLLSSYHDLRKNYGFYRARMGEPGVRRLLEEDRRFRFVAAAEEGDRLLYTREAYDEFPDMWVADRDFGGARKVTDVNPGLTETFAWGDAELVEWESLDGIPTQGVVILPDDYTEGRRYPVLVYYYRFFSQRLHEFNDPSVNHRPSFPVYASDGYVVFLPDVRFEVGRPGFSATKSVVPGVQRLVDLGIADPDRIALHGHSWSGYQTAFMVTQTDIFRTAIAGAPVSNMTSAYTGIRLGSGLARMFQYEAGQSRLSGSLWEARNEYIDNSPTFFADRINTPLLILHGDVDDAVPWEQSIELYLALRRLGKEAVFLQYRDEPHHPQTYANKLDWAMRMKEWVDHYLKDAPAPAWITEGVPYTGN
jgi:dipeptidyl aminopeptidase/acylaminoacyl peptidase